MFGQSLSTKKRPWADQETKKAVNWKGGVGGQENERVTQAEENEECDIRYWKASKETWVARWECCISVIINHH